MKNVLLAGLGNVGFPMADHIARVKDIRGCILCDPDEFSTDNLSGQPIPSRAVGRAKVDVAAERMQEINGAIEIERWRCRLETLPLGFFRNRIIISGLDTRFARARLSQICCAANCELWLDLGVRPQNRIARVSVVFPSIAGGACLCCGWSTKDYNALSAEFACNGGIKSAPTRSPAYLGGTAAAIAAELLERYVEGTLPGRQEVQHYFTSLTAHRSWITRVARNQGCRSSHNHWEMGGRIREADLESRRFSVPGLPFSQRLRCSCGAEKPLFFIAARLSEEQRRCHSCGRAMHYGALDLTDDIDFSELEDVGPERKALALADIGVLDRDIVRIGDRHFEIERQRMERANG